MVALGFGIIWVGYTIGFTGYCWVRGYDISFSQIASPVSFYTAKWPPALVSDPDVLLPGQPSTGTSKAAGGGGQANALAGGAEVGAKTMIP